MINVDKLRIKLNNIIDCEKELYKFKMEDLCNATKKELTDKDIEDLKQYFGYRRSLNHIQCLANALIDELVLEEKENEIEGVSCPLCGETLIHEEYNGTHLYKCPSCPIVAMEDVEQKDINNMFENLMKDFKR